MTKDELYNIVLDQQERSIKAMNGLTNAFERVNDTNVLHVAKDSENYESVRRLVVSFERFVKLFTISLAALIVLAGAEKVLGLL